MRACVGPSLNVRLLGMNGALPGALTTAEPAMIVTSEPDDPADRSTRACDGGESRRCGGGSGPKGSSSWYRNRCQNARNVQRRGTIEWRIERRVAGSARSASSPK